MIERLRSLLDYDKILILGFGREGKSTYRVLRALFPRKTIYIHDAKEIDGSDLTDAVLSCGDEYGTHLEEFDLVIKTPGIVLSSAQRASICRLTSQTELFLTLFAKQTIGITGTKGKSTTSSLLYHVLKQRFGNVFLIGNIGIPCFDVLDQMDDDSIIVFEMSCHQLEYTDVSPHIAVFLNIFEEHLDHYGTMDAYIAAKKNIVLHQKPQDFAFVHEMLLPLLDDASGRIVTVGTEKADVITDLDKRCIEMNKDAIVIEKDDTLLIGKHNLLNIAFAYAVCRQCFHIGESEFKDALKTFCGLEHRLQLFAVIDGVRYYDDSISTASETAIQALQSVENVQTVILGGMDRHISYDHLADYLAFHYQGHIILMPDTGKRIYELLDKRLPAGRMERVHTVSDLTAAVTLAKKLTKAGGACVLSPAAASYGFFRDFEERGNVFQALVRSARQD